MFEFNNKQKNYIESLYNGFYDNENYIYMENGNLIIESVCGDKQEWKPEKLQQAINDNSGETRKVLLKLNGFGEINFK